MKTLALIPVWLLNLLLRPLLARDHPMRSDRVTLRAWSRHATGLAIAFGIFFWFSAVSVGIVIEQLLR